MTVRQLMHLAAAMAHEVRNPLNSMAIHADLMEGRLTRDVALAQADRDALKRSAQLMAGEIERIDRILEEYLEYAGPQETARRPIDARELLTAALDRASALAAGRGVEVKLAGETALGQWAVDGEALGEVLDALLANAIEASPRGSAVEVQAQTQDDEAELTVRDHGEGIAADDLNEVFKLGFSRRGRAGIGLTVAKQIVKGHGGSINVRSQGPGEGTTVTVRLPLETET